MSLFWLVVSTVIVLSVLLYTYIVVPTFLSPLSRIPNAHFTSPFSSTWMWWNRRSGVETASIYAAHQKHGPIVRLGPNELSVASLDGLKQIYLNGFEKDEWYLDEFMHYATPNLVSMLYHKPHSIQKRMISNVYAKSYLQNSPDLSISASVILSQRFLPLLQSMAEKDAPVNVLELSQAAGIDFVSAYSFGITNSSDFIRNNRAREHYFNSYRTYIRRLPGHEFATKEIESVCFSMCQAAEDLCQSPPEKQSTSTPSTNPVVYRQLSTQLSALPTESQSSQPRMILIASEMLDHLIAGHETSAITLTYLMHELSRRPNLQKALHAELLTLSPPLIHPLREGEDFPTPSLPHPRTIDSLPLLNAILHETLRLYTATPAPQPRIVPPGGTTLDGYPNIPAGTRVSTSSYCMHRNADAYPDPLTFKPERWMQEGEKGVGGTEEMRRWFWAFGSGGRMCLGSNFAIQELKLLTAAIYTNFTTTIVDDEGIEQTDTYISGPKSDKLILKFHQVKQ